MKKIAVIGAVNYDIGARSAGPLRMEDSNPGKVSTSFGGVGRNIAEDLARLGEDVSLCTVFGDDSFGRAIRENCAQIGIDISLSETIPGRRTSSYVYISGENGDMALAVNDMSVYESLTPEYISRRLEKLRACDAIVIDANIPGETIRYIAANVPLPVIADPVSVAKAGRLAASLEGIFCIKPNRIEAEALAECRIENDADVRTAAKRIIEKGVKLVCISLSDKGLYMLRSSGEEYRAESRAAHVINTTGCGDAVTAGLAAGIAENMELKRIGDLAMRMAALTAQTERTNSTELTKDLLG